ncbi:DUF6660 family protein [Chitinophaga pendula]
MKIFAFIMACIVLALSCTYCTDGASVMKGNNQKVAIKKSDNSRNNQSDNCSPFCQCSSCPGFYISKSINSSELIVFQTSPQFSVLHSSNVIGIALPIWQPPQLIS